MKMIFSILCIFSGINAQTTILSWDANIESDLEFYKVYRGMESGVYLDSNTVQKTELSYTWSGLESGKVHFFVVTATNYAGNESGFSNEVNIFIPQVPKKPHKPSVEIIGLQMKLDTALVTNSLPIKILIPPMYEDSTQMNPALIDSIQIDIKRYPLFDLVYSFTEKRTEKLRLSPGLYYINSSVWKDGVQSDWPDIDNFFLIDSFTSRVLNIVLEIEIVIK